jgi:uncharacterized protein (UPF0261 family)
VNRKRNIAILGTLDTKGSEVVFMRQLVEDQGYSATVIDLAPLDHAPIPGLPSEEVFRWKAPGPSSEKEKIMEAMGAWATERLLSFYREGKIDGVIGLGGNQGSAVASMAMRGLPFGFPKYLVSTVASGNIRPYVGGKDIGVIFSVGDFLGGPNAVTRSILANAVSAVIGMVEHGEKVAVDPAKRTIAITALGNTEPAVREAVRFFQEKGFQVIPFHASGAGGSAMEELIEEGIVDGVLDLTPHELTEEVVGAGAYLPVKPGRLKAAGAKAIPQVISTGGMEYLCFGPRESIPIKLRNRKIYMHNPYNANVKVSRREMAVVAETMAERLNEARGPVAILIPLRGWSIYGAKGGPLHDEAGYRIFLKTLRHHLRGGIVMEEVDAHINDPVFVDRCVRQLVGFMDGRKN